jgi:archaemetzincin
MSSLRELVLVPVGPLRDGDEMLRWLAAELREWLGVPVVPGEPLEPRAEWRDPERGQLNSNRVVDALMACDEPLGAEPPDRWLLGLTEADLFAPGRDFVFGEAAQGGAWALVGLARLRADLRSPDPEALLRRRLLKVAVHELGHVAGLSHCDRPECVMFPSETIHDTDRKGASPCPACQAALADPVGVDRSPRDR